jgi:hypothetical protein
MMLLLLLQTDRQTRFLHLQASKQATLLKAIRRPHTHTRQAEAKVFTIIMCLTQAKERERERERERVGF